MKTCKILSIKKVSKPTKVYNIELESTCESEDDLFWIERGSGIVSHNCFPKDVSAFINWAEEKGISLDILKAVQKKNLELRPERDWEELKGATTKTKYEIEDDD